MRKTLLIALALLTSAIATTAQTITERQEATATLGSGTYAPMWHIANRQGLASEKTSTAYARLGAGGTHPLGKSNITLNWDLDIVAGHNTASPIFIQQANIDLNWKKLQLSVGQKERWSEYGNHRLTTGSLVESGNARPIPQVRIALPQYWDIPGCQGWFAIKGHLAYGTFTDGKWQENFVAPDKARTSGVLYHSKAGLMRLGNEKKFPLTAEIGLQMVAQFGGTTYNRLNTPGTISNHSTRFKDFLMVLIPVKGDEQYNIVDQVNIAGNVLGSWQGAINWNSKKWRLGLYYDHVFEDHSQMFWEYGLWTEQLIGLELELRTFKWIKHITAEYFNLKLQSGPIYHDSTTRFPDQISCADNNYWHHTYGGWFNYGQMIGTPLCTSPIYNTDNTLGIYNTRVEAFHAGIEGTLLPWLHYRLLFTHSNNWGTYFHPFKDIKHNTSGLVEFTFTPNLPGGQWAITTSFALDKGRLYGNNYGAMLSIKRCGTYTTKKAKNKATAI